MRRKTMRICRVALVVSGIWLAAVASAAPVRWELEDGGNGHLYEVVGVGSVISWESARAAARARGPGWDLATITSAKENDFVKSLFQTDSTFLRWFTRCGEPTICWYRIGPWIGGFGVTDTLEFQWVTGEPVAFTDWASRSFLMRGSDIAYVDRYFSATPGFAWSTPSPYPVAYVAELTTDWIALVLSESTVAGCRTVTGTVMISEPAPPEGRVVAIGDTIASAISPSVLQILPGAKSGDFTIRTRPVAARETGTVRVRLGSAEASRELTVRPIGLQYVALSEPTVVGGASLTGRAILECRAAPGPITVKLASNHPQIAYPVAASIVVPQGVRAETFDIATQVVPDESSAAIIGRANGTRKARLLKVTPAE